ncbi:MAG: glycosyltransferase family 2 protein [Thermoplasmatota archaeon]|jgi:glycosyltransferase involved in cell wall biosynthesis
MENKKIDLSIIIPCYNEEKNVPLIVDALKNELKENKNLELILVDNGSTDNTGKKIDICRKKFKNIKKVRVKVNQGYGFGIYSGLKKARGEFLCWTHGDMQTNPLDCLRALEEIKKQKNPEKCFVKGRRIGRTFVEKFFTFGMSVFESLLFKKILYDINAQPNLFHKSFLRVAKNPPKDFSFDLYFYVLAAKNNFKIIRFPVRFEKRKHGKSKWNVNLKERIRFIKRTIDYSFKLKRCIDE